MNAELVKARLKERNITQAQLARRYRVSTAAMTLFINGKMTSRRLEKGVARSLGMSVEELRNNGINPSAGA